MKLRRLTHTRKLSGRLYDTLEGMILKGDIKAGDRLPTEAILCDKLGVSRTSLREALQQLKGRGLIESTAGRGMFVRSIGEDIMTKELHLFAQVEQDSAAFFELIKMRLMLEPDIAAKACRGGRPAFLAELQNLLAEMKANTANLSAFMEADLDMHLLISREANNRFVNMILSCVKPLGKRFGQLSHGSENFVLETLEEHSQIVQAMAAGDSRKARKAMRDHLLSSKAHFEEQYKTA